MHWLTSAARSWLAALAALAAVSWLGVAGDQLPLGEWPLAIGATGALHFALAAMLYEPVVRLLLAGNARAIVRVRRTEPVT